MAAAEPKVMRLKLLIDTKGKRVLYAEAGKDFVDFLFQSLSLPVGTVVSLPKPQVNAGALANLYESMKNLNESYLLKSKQTKDPLLKPLLRSLSASQGFNPLLPANNASAATKCYACNYCRQQASLEPNTTCPRCNYKMGQVLSFVGVSVSEEVGFVKDMVPYMVMDDLSVTPLSTMSSFALLRKLDVKDMSVVEEKVVNFGKDEVFLIIANNLSKYVYLYYIYTM
ncbi:hypothetical protein MIMGU_mgv1a024286mg [Erythranthe guttata]|uniref:DUF674 domain-containing protein n=1 Tax=Erythranthe guttata TaxID=4155 RepID=A0A022R6P1_ERYGU|nr:hypothetical protein MIMGU_mgv1a024286mg [Erythranthe guttata]